jgi:ribosomal protein S18 acetylase RimI-like enzyme
LPYRISVGLQAWCIFGHGFIVNGCQASVILFDPVVMMNTPCINELPSAQYFLRPLTSADAEHAYAISADSAIDWGETVADWRATIALAAPHAFAIATSQFPDRDQQIVAVAMAIIFGEKTRILNVLVHPNWQKKGLGKRLFAHLVKSVDQQGARYLELEASAAGLHLYRSFGFIEDYRIFSYSQLLTPPADDEEHRDEMAAEMACSDKDLPAICTLEAEAFGSSRAELLEEIYRLARERLFVDRGQHGPVGFILYSEERAGIRIGPWVHRNPQYGSVFFTKVLTIIRRRFAGITCSIHTAHHAAIDLVGQMGFVLKPFETFHMHRSDSVPSPVANSELYLAMWDFGIG